MFIFYAKNGIIPWIVKYSLNYLDKSLPGVIIKT